jgi:hypothetical protein
MRCMLLWAFAVACAAASQRALPTSTQTRQPDASSDVDATPLTVPEAGTTTSSALRCDPPRVRDTVTLECTSHTPCPAGQDLVSGSCVPSCWPGRPTRDSKGACGCPPGTTDVQGAEFGGCLKPGDLDFSSMCKQPHMHLDASIAPVCKCDAPYVETYVGIGLLQCVRSCKAPLVYDQRSDSCRTCPSEDRVGLVCLPKCPAPSKRVNGDCSCPDAMFMDQGHCVHCTADRAYDAATGNCNCAAGTKDWGYEGCIAVCPGGHHRMHKRCDPDCAAPLLSDAKSGTCVTCDPAAGGFVYVEHGRRVCVVCSFDEELANGECTCRPGFRVANGHCVNP